MSKKAMLIFTLDIPMNETTPDMYKCEDYFEANEMNITQGIQGMSSDAFYRNLRLDYINVFQQESSSKKSFKRT